VSCAMGRPKASRWGVKAAVLRRVTSDLWPEAERQIVNDQRLVAQARSLGLGQISAPFLPHFCLTPGGDKMAKFSFRSPKVTKSHQKSRFVIRA